MTPESKRTVLVVEDDAALRNVLTLRLTRLGFHVINCANGNDAVAMCHDHIGEIDVVLSDMVMPGITGGEAARLIAEFQPSMPIVLMSGYIRDENVDAACAGPHRYFLEKPFETSALTAVLAEALGAPVLAGSVR